MTAGRRRALVIHPGALGDVLQAVPALRALGRVARITFCGQPRLAELLAGAGVVDDAVSFDNFGLDALFSDAPVPAALAGRLGDFAVIVSWFGSRDPRYSERIRTFAPACVVAPPVPDGEESVAVWQHLLATLDPIPALLRLDAPLELPAPTAALTLPEPWLVRARQALDEAGARRDPPLLVVHPGAGARWKIAPPALLASAVARAGDVELLLHIGPADGDAATRLIDALDSLPPRLIEPPLPVLAGVLRLAGAYLGADSGVSHLAAAVGAPAVVLFPAVTRKRWAPWSPSATVVDLEPVERIAVEDLAAALRAAIFRRGDEGSAHAPARDGGP